MGESRKGTGKLKIALVISVIVIVVLGGSNIWFFVNKQSLELQIDDLWDDYGSEQWWHGHYQNLSDQLSTEKANLQNQVNTLTIERDNLQSQVNSLTSQVATLQTQYDTLNASCYEALMNFSSLQNQYEALNASYYEALADIASLQTDFTNMTNWKDSLQATVTVLQDQIDNLNAQIAEKTATIANLQAQIADLEDQVDQLNTIIAQKDAIIAEKNATIADLEARLDELAHVLTDKEYYHSIKSDLENATETILVAMYSMIYDPGDSYDWANDLIKELVYAKDRGVNVTVIIEYRTFFDYMDENLEAYEYLSDNGVTVKLDNDTDTDHLKLVIIDDKIVYVGSHNWSESALYYNRETSVKIISEDIAEIFKTYFETI